MNDPLRELMDGCRPQGDDLLQPEMQPLAKLVADDAVATSQLDRSRQLDTAIAGAVHDVPIPAGLEQRLLLAVAESQAGMSERSPAPLGDKAEAGIFDAEAGANHSDAEAVTPRSGRASRSWRVWATLGTCAAMLALIVIPLVVNRPPPGEIDAQALASSALSWAPNENTWTQGKEIWTAHPLPNQIVSRGVKRRQKVVLPAYVVTASCYDLNLPPLTRGGKSARLFVFATPPSFRLPAAPPRLPAVSTGGMCVGAWNSGGLTYVLVVTGDEADYQKVIQPASIVASGPLPDARLCPIRTA